MLDGHVGLDIECLDRIYLNGYRPEPAGRRAGGDLPEPASGLSRSPPRRLCEQIGARFRRAVARFAQDNGIPVVRVRQEGDRKVEVMHPYLQRLAAAGVSGVAAIGVGAGVRAGVHRLPARRRHSTIPQFTFAKADRRVTCYYFYVWDTGFGPGFIKICSYFPYPIKVWVNGHEWAKRQATTAGIAFTELSNGFATCTDPQALQAICDQLGPGADPGVRRALVSTAADRR